MNSQVNYDIFILNGNKMNNKVNRTLPNSIPYNLHNYHVHLTFIASLHSHLLCLNPCSYLLLCALFTLSYIHTSFDFLA